MRNFFESVDNWLYESEKIPVEVRGNLHSSRRRLLDWEMVLKDLWNKLQSGDEDLMVHCDS